LWSIQNGIQSVLRFEQFEIYQNVQECINKIKKEIKTLDTALRHDKTRVEKIKNERQELISRNREKHSESQFSNIHVEIWRDEDDERKKQRELEEKREVSRSTYILPMIQQQELPEINYPVYEATYKELKPTKIDQYKPPSLEEQIPHREQSVLQEMKCIPQSQKGLLMKFIKNSNKDGISKYSGNINDIQNLIELRLIVPNRMNPGTFFVLPDTPYLFNILKDWKPR